MKSSTTETIKKKYTIFKKCGNITCEYQELSNCCESAVVGDVCEYCKEHCSKVKL